MNNPLSRILRLLPVALALVIAGCGGSADSNNNNANIRVLNLSPGYPSLDLLSNNGDTDVDTTQFTAVARGTISNYSSLEADTYTLKFRRTGTSSNLWSSTATLTEDTHLTYIALGETNQFGLMGIDEDLDAPATGYSIVRVLNTLPEGVFDVYLTGANDSLDDVSATVSAVAPGGTSAAATISSGTFRLRVTGTGVKTDLKLNVPSVVLASKAVVSIILTESNGGVLVNAVVLPQQGAPTFYDNTTSAKLRVLNVSTGYPSLDVFTGLSNVDTQQFTAVGNGTISAYASLKADTYQLKFRRAGATGTLLSQAVTLADDTQVTYVTYGSTNRFAMQYIGENQSAADAGYTRVQILNTSTSDPLDVYLTGATDELSDVSATVSAVSAAAFSTVQLVTSGTYRMRITAAGSKTDLRLDTPAVVLASQGNLTIVLSDTAGGTLVGAVALPQQGEAAFFTNSKVRVRGAAGLSVGSAVTINVGGTEIVTRRPARSFIADTYTSLDAGTNVPVTVSVDNVAVATGTVNLAAGADYTLLAWDVGAAPQLTLVADDNHTLVNSRVKLRLLNGYSGAAVPLTLSVNFAPVAEYIDVGTGSSYAELGAGTDFRFDVSNAQTLASLLSRESVTLLADGVYTFFVAGSGSTVVGTLRKDR